MTTVTIHDEGMRRALEAVLWELAVDTVEPPTETKTIGRAFGYATGVALAVDPSHEAEVHVAKAEAALETLQAIREGIGQIRSAALGDSIDLSLDPERIAQEADFCRGTIESGSYVWEVEPGKREQVLATRDAAARLVAEFSPQAVT
jgi:hypothetical protein